MTIARKNRLLQLLRKRTLSGPERAAIAAEIERLDRDLERARRQALTDELTKAPNPRAFRQELEQAVRMYEQGRIAPFALIAIDLVGFKAVNDHYGQSAGDAALKEFVEFLAGSLRKPDTGRRKGGWRGEAQTGLGDRRAHDRFYRRGGDEFNVIVPTVRTRREAQLIADRLCRSFEFEYEGRALRLSARAAADVTRPGSARTLERAVECRLARLKRRTRRRAA